MFIKKIQRRIKGGSFIKKTQRRIGKRSLHFSKDHRTMLVSSHMHTCWCSIALVSSHTKEDQKKIWCFPTRTHASVFLHCVGVFPHATSCMLLLLPYAMLLFDVLHIIIVAPCTIVVPFFLKQHKATMQHQLEMFLK
jgi:hypothetical protein